MKWSSIEKLPEDYLALENPELRSMQKLWETQRDRITKLEAFEEFNKRLNREFAIETGLIEGLYSLDRGITQTLVEYGFDAALIPHGSAKGQSPIHVIRLLRDQEDSLQSLFDFVRQDRTLSGGYIKELHAQLTRNQNTTEAIDQFGNLVEVKLEKGTWKKRPNNPTRNDGSVHEYAPVEQVESEIDRLCELHTEYRSKNVPIEIQTSWLHHRFTQIHPFQDGNGRVARALASLCLLREGLFPFTVHLEKRGDYISALENADNGDLSSLTKIVSDQQLRALRRVLSIAEQIERSKADQSALITSALNRLKDRYKAEQDEYSKVYELESKVFAEISSRLDAVAQEINESSGQLGVEAFVAESNENNSHYYGFDVISIAKELGYFSNWKAHHRWMLLGITEKLKNNQSSRFDIVFSCHPIGRDFQGALVIIAFAKRKSEKEGDQTVIEAVPLNENPYTFYYNQKSHEALRPLTKWLDASVRNGLAQWQKSL